MLLIQGAEARFETIVAQSLAESLDPSEKGERRYRLWILPLVCIVDDSPPIM